MHINWILASIASIALLQSTLLLYNDFMKVKTDPEIIKRLTERGIEKIVPSKEKLVKLLKSGKKLNVYQGFDPTADSLHIGHTVGMRKLRDFQLLGHHVIFLIGDFTGRIGDPSDKLATRKQLTEEQVKKNMKNFKDQASSILDFENKENPIEIKCNSSWLEKLNFAEILELCSDFTVQQMIKREMFQKRLETDKPIHLHEFLYPVMQAHDSITMDIDVEVGGNDQLFNMLCGRDLTSKRLKKEKFILAGKLLEDPTGKKMGKTEGNMIKLNDSPKDMYGKVMALTDNLIIPAYEILTDVPLDEIHLMEKDMKDEKVNPMELKKKLAFNITEQFTSTEEAKKAQRYFEDVFQKSSLDSEEIQNIKVSKPKIKIVELLTRETKFADSNSQAKRLIKQGAVYINGKRVKDKELAIQLSEEPTTLKAGKKICRITLK